MPSPITARLKRYEHLADLLAADIRSGLRPAGSRMPSVREVMARHSLSASTVFQAYARLEDKGLVRARPRSGYFVTGAVGLPPAALPHKDAPTRGKPAARLAPRLDVSELVFSVLAAVQDPDVVPLGSAFPSPDLFPLRRLGQSLARGTRGLRGADTVASLPKGHPALRTQIARRYLALGMPQAADDLIVTSGALEGLTLALSAVAQPGDLVAIESPGFYASLQALERLKMRALEIPVHPQRGMDLQALASALERHPVKACWFMTTLQNPTGATLNSGQKQALVRLLASHRVPLIEDDVYGELYFGNQPPLPAKAFDLDGGVIHCSSFSKTLAPGYRVGWVSPGRYGQQIERLKLMTTLAASLPAQLGLADYLQHGGYDRHLRRLRHALESQLSALLAAVARYFPPDVQVSRPEGGYFLWVAFAEGFDTLALHQSALAAGISVAPGPVFSARRRFAHCVRLNFGHPWDGRVEQAMKTLGELASRQAPYALTRNRG